jgi:hypothetical protein
MPNVDDVRDSAVERLLFSKVDAADALNISVRTVSTLLRAERHGFEYYRHGTLSLYAALDVKTGKVEGKTAKRHTSAEFIAFLSRLLSQAGRAKEIHIVLDNLSAHTYGHTRSMGRGSGGTWRDPVAARWPTR